MFDKHFIGLDITSFENNGLQRAISRVTLLVDDENSYTAGDDTGREMVANCSHATQEMVDSILESLKGYRYQMFDAGDANIDPAAELGDGATVNGIYSSIARFKDDGSGYLGISAPGESELDDEYPTAGPMTKEFNRKIAFTRSLITKTAEQIRLEVSNEVEGLSSSIDVKLDSITAEIVGLENAVSSIELELDSITSRVQDAEGNISTLEQTTSKISARVTSVEGDVTSLEVSIDSIEGSVSDIESGLSQTVRIAADGVTITNAAGSRLTIDGGQIDAENLNLSGRITFDDLSSSVQNDINDAYTMAEDAADLVGGWTYVGTTYIDGTKIKTGTISASTLEGGEIYLLDASGDPAGAFELSGASSYSGQKMQIYSGATAVLALYGSVYIGGADGAFIDVDRFVSIGGGDLAPSTSSDYSCGTSSRRWTDIYSDNATIQTSDREKKTEINYDLSRYDALFDQLAPCSYRFVDGQRTHMGLIAQDVESAMLDSLISDMEFAGWIRSSKRDENGQIIDNEYDYALRYTEFVPLLIRQVQILKQRVAALEGS